MSRFHLSLVLLALSAASFWLSDLRFAWHDALRFWLAVAGCVLGMASLVAGLLARTWRLKLAAMAAIVGGAVLTLHLSAPLAHASFRLYVREHGEELARVARLIHAGEATYATVGAVCRPRGAVGDAECAALADSLRASGVVRASRLERGGAMLELYGFLDSRGGVIYCAGSTAAACGWRDHATHLGGPWSRYGT